MLLSLCRSRRPGTLALLLTALCSVGRADITGMISGIVRDPSDATVAGANVTLHNPDTGLNRSVHTDATGLYEFLSVPVGEHYSIEVEAPGFQKAVVSKLRLLVDQRFRADIQLSVGAVTQEVNVTAAEAQVE